MSRRRRPAPVVVALAVVAGLAIGPAAAFDGERAVTFTTHPIDHFRIGRPAETRFGRLAFVGGFEVEASLRAVGGLSGIDMAPDGTRFLAISDDGLMLAARILRDAAGRPEGWTDGVLRAMRGADGRDLGRKDEADSEAIDRIGPAGRQEVLVSFEGAPRVLRGAVGPDGFPGPLAPVPLPDATKGLRSTRGIEALAAAPSGHPFAGGFIVIGESAPRGAKTEDKAAWLIGPSGFAFSIAADGAFDVTDARFGPDGDLYLLERAFSIGSGVGAQIRRIETGAIVPGARTAGTVLFRADLSHQIDNMEGFDFWTDGAGRTRLSLISDDNRSFLQRTLYLEFVMEP